MTIRDAAPGDLAGIVALCGEHAAFERAAFSAEKALAALGGFLFRNPPRARCLVVEADGELVGYATWSLEFSTWGAAEYAHMDCLFLREAHRGAGIGEELVRRVGAAAAGQGGAFVEWQTPSWNTRAMRFYKRLGAAGSPKMRYRWRP